MTLLGLTPYSMTLLLAYCHYYTPNFLSGRCLPASHLRQLAAWLQQPNARLRSARAHPRLAIHLAAAHAANLLSIAGGDWQLTPFTLDFLQAAHPQQIRQLLTGFQTTKKWEEAEQALGLHDLFKIDYLAYLQQQLERQIAHPPTPAPAAWVSCQSNEWQIALPTEIRPDTLFHLLQMGRWSPDTPWQSDPIAIARAAQRGYSLTLMETALTNALDKPLDPDRHNQLIAWYANHDAVQIRPVYLLSAKQPGHLDAIMTRRRLRQHVQQRLSQRHAIVSPKIGYLP